MNGVLPQFKWFLLGLLIIMPGFCLITEIDFTGALVFVTPWNQMHLKHWVTEATGAYFFLEIQFTSGEMSSIHQDLSLTDQIIFLGNEFFEKVNLCGFRSQWTTWSRTPCFSLMRQCRRKPGSVWNQPVVLYWNFHEIWLYYIESTEKRHMREHHQHPRVKLTRLRYSDLALRECYPHKVTNKCYLHSRLSRMCLILFACIDTTQVPESDQTRINCWSNRSKQGSGLHQTNH